MTLKNNLRYLFIFLIPITITTKLFSQDIKVYNTVEVPSYYNGGEKELGKFINNNKKYPLKGASLEYEAWISFKVDTTGKISDVKIIKGLGKAMNDDLIRIIGLMPKWEPAKIKGIKVESIVYLSIQYLN